MSNSQVDKIGDRLRDGLIDEQTLRGLEEYRAGFSDAYKYVEYFLRDTLGRTVTGRPSKSTLAIVEKLKRQKTRLAQIQDIAGCRVIVANIPEQESFVRGAEILLRNVQIDDKRSEPTNGYRAIHLIVRKDGKLVEVQVRTKLQHAWAELSEKIADAYGQEIKYGEGAEWAVKFLLDLSAKVAQLEHFITRTVTLERTFSPDATRKEFSARKKLRKSLEQAARLKLYEINALFNEIRER